MEYASNHKDHQAGASTSAAGPENNSSLAYTPSIKSRGDHDDRISFDGSRSQIGIKIVFKGFLSRSIARSSAANPPHATRNKNKNDPVETQTHTNTCRLSHVPTHSASISIFQTHFRAFFLVNHAS